MVVRCPISFNFLLFVLQFFCDWYGPLMVAVLCALIAINVTLSANVAICVVDYVKHDNVYLHVKSYMCSSINAILVIMLDYDFDLCV